jgi:hypothetical protein
LGLATIVYCLRVEAYLFVASYDSQGDDGGIRPRLHTGHLDFLVKVKVKVTLRLTVYRQSVRLGVRPLEAHDQRFFPTELLR